MVVHRLPLIRAGAVAAVVSCLLVVCGVARADLNPVIVALEVAPEEWPAHVCVVHFGTEGLASRDLDDELFALAPIARESAAEEAARTRVEAARRVLDGRRGCGLDVDACRPSLDYTPPAAARIACVANDRPAADLARLLVIEVRFETSTPPLDTLSANGSIVTMQFRTGVRVSASDGRVAVVAGDYGTASGADAGAGRVALPLAARCVARDVLTPPVQRGSAGARLRITPPGRSAACPEIDWADRFEVWLSRGAPGRWRRLDLQVITGRRVLGRFERGWSDAEPPQTIELLARTLTFRWRAACDYEASGCPTASLANGAVHCEGQRRDGGVCAYECPAGSAAPEFSVPDTLPRFEVPATVSFTGGQSGENAWSEPLSRVDQELAGYARRNERSYRVDFAPEYRLHAADGDSPIVGDRIRSVTITSPSGEQFEFDPAGEGANRITIRGGSCGVQLSYRVRGDRPSAVGSVQIENGVVTVPQPSITALDSYVGFSIGGGYQRPVPGEDLPGSPFLMVSMTLRWWPPWSAPHWALNLRLELELLYLLSERFFYPAQPPETRDPALFARVLYNRGAALPGIYWGLLAHRFELGLNLGVVAGAPLHQSDEDALHSYLLAPMWVLAARYRLAATTWLQAAFRMIWPDHVDRWSYSLAGDPSVETEAAKTMFFEASIRAWL